MCEKSQTFQYIIYTILCKKKGKEEFTERKCSQKLYGQNWSGQPLDFNFSVWSVVMDKTLKSTPVTFGKR